MNVIEVRNLGKLYSLDGGAQGKETLREAIYRWCGSAFKIFKKRKASKELWAISNLNFDIQEGDVVGIIGRNGAGKTTLLRLLSETTVPTIGEIKIRGRVGSLLGANTGFHPDLSARENIYLVAAILGMSREQIHDQFDAIVEFSEVEAFLDTPVKHFSSGMMMKLGFSIAVHLLPEILILDEALSVGDLAFQQKAMARARQIATSNRTILFVSHNMATIQALCNKCLVLNQGQQTFFGSVGEGLEHYSKMFDQVERGPIAERTDRRGDGSFRILDLYLPSGEDQVKSNLPATFLVKIKRKHNGVDETLRVTLFIKNTLGHSVFMLSNDYTKEVLKVRDDVFEVKCHIPHVPLTRGQYQINVRVMSGEVLCDEVLWAKKFDVSGDVGNTSSFSGASGLMIPQSWEVID